MLPSYRNQSIDLLSKSIDWFLHEGNTSTQGVNQMYALIDIITQIVIKRTIS